MEAIPRFTCHDDLGRCHPRDVVCLQISIYVVVCFSLVVVFRQCRCSLSRNFQVMWGKFWLVVWDVCRVDAVENLAANHSSACLWHLVENVCVVFVVDIGWDSVGSVVGCSSYIRWHSF